MDLKLSCTLETNLTSRKEILTQHLASMTVLSKHGHINLMVTNNFFLRLYDSDGSLMETFCGDTVPPFSYVSVANKMTVEFTSDLETEAAGFIAYWDRVPPNGTVARYIQSPNYPNKYEYCENERWVLQGPKVLKNR